MLLGVIVLWICEPVPIPVGGLIGVGAIVVLGVAPAGDVLAPFGSTSIFTFIGAFILAQSMLKHGIAQLMQDRGIVKEDFDPLRLRVGAALMLMLAYRASVGGLLTPVGSPPNLIGRGLIEEAKGIRISFAQWMVMVFPICLGMFIVLAATMFLLNRPEVRRLDGVEDYVREQREAQGPMDRTAKNTIIAFGVTITLWLLPAVVSLFAGTDSELYIFMDDRLDEGIVAVLGASLLFILPKNWAKREPTSPGPRPPRSTGARSCSSARASSSAPCWPRPSAPAPPRPWGSRAWPRSRCFSQCWPC